MAADTDLLLRSARDWNAWESYTEGELRKEGLWLVVEKGDTTASAASGSSASLVTITVPLRDTFAERDSRALGLIRALWEALKKEYSQANKTEIAFALLQQLLRRKLRLEDGQEKVTLSGMTAHVDKFASDLNRLDGLGYSVDADLQPLFLRRTLPKTSGFEALQASILGSVAANSKLTRDQVEAKI
ncbi:hypothetical protein R3P38DRAFT_3215694 [Favolaschia claudopus]|uniref:Uncharacterized protein n=1 Tax=Favolaschia claudopus TaxID=2862362 RepID=A0AAW0A9D6_9AGAR